MRGRLLNLVAVLSLPSCAALAALCVRSYFVSDGVTWTTRDASIYGAKWARGRMEIVRLTSDPKAFEETQDSVAFERPAPGLEYTRGDPATADQWGFEPPRRDVKFLGVRFRSGPVLFMHAQHVSMPVAYVCAAAGVLPGVWLARRWRKARRLRNHECAV